MAKRRSKNSLFGEIAYRVSGLAGFGIFVASYQLRLFDSFSPSEQILFPTLLAVAGMFGCAIIFLMIQRAIDRNRKGVQTFDFEQPATTKHQQATQFEHETAKLIQALTGKQTEVVGGSGDGGIDIKVYDNKRKLVGIVQCKHLQPNKTVYPTYIRELNSVRHYHHINIAYLVTTGRFSNKSYDLAKDLGVRLIDGERLKKLRKQVAQPEPVR